MSDTSLVKVDNALITKESLNDLGIGLQKEISNISDALLKEVKAKDSGYVGELLNDLTLKIKNADPDSFASKTSKIPILGSLFQNTQKFVAKQETLQNEIEQIENNLGKARLELLKDNTLLDTFYDKLVGLIGELDSIIETTNTKLENMRTSLPLEQPDDMMAVQTYNDSMDLIDRAEKKVHDFKVIKTVAIQNIPQLRLIQKGNLALADKISSSLAMTIPLWKQQMILAITTYRQQKGLEYQNATTKLTNQLLEQTSDNLKANTIGIAKAMESSIIDIETLKKTNTNLLNTIKETIEIHNKGKQDRMQASNTLAEIEDELKTTIKALADDIR